MKYKLIFFDLDGTLVDTIIDIKNATNFVLNKYGLVERSRDEVREIIGGGAKNLVKRCLKGSNYSIKEVLPLFIDYYTKHYCDYSRPYDGVIEVLDKLSCMPDLKKIVLTNKPLGLSEMIIEKLELKKYFKYIIAPESFGVRKPDPLPVVETLKKYNLNHDDAVMIGDSKADIELSRNAGISSITVSYGYGDLNDLKKADFIVNDFREIIEILD